VEDSQFNSCCKEAIMGKIPKKIIVGYGPIIDHFGSTNPLQERWCTTIERICYLLPKPTCPFGRLVAKVFGHASKSLNCLSKLKVDGLIYHPFIGFQNHGTICDSSFICFFKNVTSFDLWMFRSGNDTFAFVINFINS